MTNTPPRILIIAGSDSSGGAGIQADIKTITMLGGYAMTAITAITAQNTTGVSRVDVLQPAMVAAQVDACLEDIGVDVVKIGMLGSPDIAAVVAERLAGLDVPVVFDPVMVASSGAVLADEATIAGFERLMDCALLVTPNLPELEVLTGLAGLAEVEAITEAAAALAERHGCAVLAKGGHAGGERVRDVLVHPDGRAALFEDPRIVTRHTHGTGCTLASAIATLIGHGQPLEHCVRLGRRFVRAALEAAPGFGAGAGPMGHQAVRDALRSGGPSLNQVTLPARAYAPSVAFYRLLGLVQIVDSPDNGYARFECTDGSTLSISTGHGVAGGVSVYFEYADLEGAIADLRRKGLEIPDPVAQSWLWHESWIEDPAGNRLCLYHAGANRRFPPWRMGSRAG